MSSTYLTRDDIEAAKDLVLEFWATMDAASDAPGESLFIEGGTLTIDPVSSPVIEVRGRAQLAEFCRRRLETARSQKRLTRHVVSNLRVVDARAGTIPLKGYVTDYVGVGDLPLPLHCPTAVADFDYDIERENHAGPWRLSHVRGKVLFAAPK